MLPLLVPVAKATARTQSKRKPTRAPRPVLPGRISARSLGAASRTPLHPGHFLDTRFLGPLGISQQDLASALGISRRRVNEIIRGHRGITPDTAVRLACYFRNDAAFWLELQLAWDLHAAIKNFRAPPKRAPR
jgi:addiction module HigA family antidote